MPNRRVSRRHYVDRASVRRHVSVKVGKETLLQLQTLHVGLPCRISQTGLAREGQTELRHPIRYDAKLFCDPGIDIRQGDLIEVSRGGSARQYVAGEPFGYPGHQEINLTRKGDA